MSSKIDRRLIEEHQIRQQRATAEGKTAQVFAFERYPVTLELRKHLHPPKGLNREDVMNALKRQVEKAQAGVVSMLTKMGVTDFDCLPLSNSIRTDLTMDQIQELCEQTDVKMVRLIQNQKVTGR